MERRNLVPLVVRERLRTVAGWRKANVALDREALDAEAHGEAKTAASARKSEKKAEETERSDGISPRSTGSRESAHGGQKTECAEGEEGSDEGDVLLCRGWLIAKR